MCSPPRILSRIASARSASGSASSYFPFSPQVPRFLRQPARFLQRALLPSLAAHGARCHTIAGRVHHGPERGRRKRPQAEKDGDGAAGSQVRSSHHKRTARRRLAGRPQSTASAARRLCGLGPDDADSDHPQIYPDGADGRRIRTGNGAIHGLLVPFHPQPDPSPVEGFALTFKHIFRKPITVIIRTRKSRCSRSTAASRC